MFYQYLIFSRSAFDVTSHPLPSFPFARSWSTSNLFQLAITPKVFDQIQKFFHRNTQKNLFFFKILKQKWVRGTLIYLK